MESASMTSASLRVVDDLLVLRPLVPRPSSACPRTTSMHGRIGLSLLAGLFMVLSTLAAVAVGELVSMTTTPRKE